MYRRRIGWHESAERRHLRVRPLRSPRSTTRSVLPRHAETPPESRGLAQTRALLRRSQAKVRKIAVAVIASPEANRAAFERTQLANLQGRRFHSPHVDL